MGKKRVQGKKATRLKDTIDYGCRNYSVHSHNDQSYPFVSFLYCSISSGEARSHGAKGRGWVHAQGGRPQV